MSSRMPKGHKHIAEELALATADNDKDLFSDITCYYGCAGAYLMEQVLQVDGDFMIFRLVDGRYRMGIRWNNICWRKKLKNVKEEYKFGNTKIRASSPADFVNYLETRNPEFDCPAGARTLRGVPRSGNLKSPLSLEVGCLIKRGTFADTLRCKFARSEDGVISDGIIKVGKAVDVGNELKALVGLDRSDFIRIEGMLLVKNTIQYIQEYTPNGTLKDYLRGTKVCQWEKEKFVYDIFRACAYLEHKRIIHCNIHSDNIMITRTMTAKLIGFRCARKSSDTCTPTGGNLRNSSPEVLLHGAVSPALDTWAAGLVAFEMAGNCANEPFHLLDKFDVRVHLASYSGKVVDTPPNASRMLVFIIHACLVRDPSLRMGAGEVVKKLIPFYNND